MNNSTGTIRLLGYAGLIPFIIPALLVASASEYAQQALSFAGVYAFGITSFLCGSWWGAALDSGSSKILWFSNLYFLTALVIFVFAPFWWPLAAAVMLIAILCAEIVSGLFPELTVAYRKMRVLLTLIAAASMLAIHLSA